MRTLRAAILVACILAACRGLGWLAYRVRQPQVIAEMVAGFLLGPSFLGWLAPGFQTSLFPAARRQVPARANSGRRWNGTAGEGAQNLAVDLFGSTVPVASRGVVVSDAELVRAARDFARFLARA
jgi:hypothetical protein